jgi:aspartate/methionine/tyrosine aminotransferase
MRDEYVKRRKFLLKAISKIPKFKCTTPKGAFYAFPNISELSKDSLSFTKFLVEKAHVVVSPGVGFGPSGEGHLRISYACSIENLQEAMRRIQDSVEGLEKTFK